MVYSGETNSVFESRKSTALGAAFLCHTAFYDVVNKCSVCGRTVRLKC